LFDDSTQDNLWDISDASLDALGEPFKSQLKNMGDDTGEYLDMALSISNFPSLPVVNNMSIGYLASNANQIAYQFQSADWTQQRALGMAQGSYDVATGAMHTAMNSAGSTMNADIAQTANLNRQLAAQALNETVFGATGAIGSAMTPAGAGGGLVSGLSQTAANAINKGIQGQTNDEALAIRNTQNAEQTINENRQSQLVRDTNKSLADWAAKGDYGNQISGINAKIQDAKMIQPSVSGQFGGESHNIGTNKMEVSLRWKLIDDSNMRVVGEIWLRYGYAVRAFIQMPASLMAMTKFTYWKITETYLSGASVPEGHKQVIRGIMEKGVTLWANPDDIGNIDWADNAPLGGISY
jgi:hypothetical protein